MFHLFEEIGAIFCCKNDEYFTFKKDMTIISAIVGYSRDELDTFYDIIIKLTFLAFECDNICVREHFKQVRAFAQNLPFTDSYIGITSI